MRHSVPLWEYITSDATWWWNHVKWKWMQIVICHKNRNLQTNTSTTTHRDIHIDFGVTFCSMRKANVELRWRKMKAFYSYDGETACVETKWEKSHLMMFPERLSVRDGEQRDSHLQQPDVSTNRHNWSAWWSELKVTVTCLCELIQTYQLTETIMSFTKTIVVVLRMFLCSPWNCPLVHNINTTTCNNKHHHY